eukprot:scaffold202_cov180-Amphora_coffeaeformis.AAC.1
MTAAGPAGTVGAPLPKSQAYRLFLIFFGMLQITLGAGLIVGWAAIAGSMMVDPTAVGGAGLTLDATTQLYGLAASVNYISPLFLGMVLDKYGPRAASCFANATVAIGCLVFAMATSLRSFNIGLCLMAFGGPAVQTSLIHIGNLFPSRRFFIMGIVSESITLSFAVLPLMDLIYHATKTDFRTIFYVQAILVALSAVASFFVWPDLPYETPDETVPKSLDDKDDKDENHMKNPMSSMRGLVFHEDNVGNTIIKSMRGVVFHEDEDDGDDPPTETTSLMSGKSTAVDLKHASLYGQVSSVGGPTFTLQPLRPSIDSSKCELFYTVVVLLWDSHAHMFDPGHVRTTQLGDERLFDAGTQHELAEILSFIDAGAIVCAPFSGFMLETVGFTQTALFTIMIGTSWIVILMLAGASEILMVTSFVAYAIFRSFLFPYFFATLSRKMGFRFFGMLSGLAFCTSGLTQFAIAPIALLVEGDCHEYDMINPTASEGCDGGSWKMVHFIQLANTLLLLSIPYLDTQHS